MEPCVFPCLPEEFVGYWEGSETPRKRVRPLGLSLGPPYSHETGILSPCMQKTENMDRWAQSFKNMSRFLFTPFLIFQVGLLSLAGCMGPSHPTVSLSHKTTQDLIRGLKTCSENQKIRVEVFPFRPYRPYRGGSSSPDRIAHLFFEDIEHPGSGSREAHSAEEFRIRMIEALIRSPDLTDIVASRSIRNLASRERLFQMSHALPPTIQQPGKLAGATFAVVGRYAKKGGDRLSIDLEAVDLASDRICWVRTVDIIDR